MVLKSLVVAALVAVGSALAQQNSPGPSSQYTVAPGSVDLNLRIAWCRAQQNTCLDLCRNRTKSNTCDPNQLKFSCECFSGSTPNLSEFSQTLPSLQCEEWRKQCIQSHPNDLAGQNMCLGVSCGNKSVEAGAGSGNTNNDSSSNQPSSSSPGPSSNSGSQSTSTFSSSSSPSSSNSASSSPVNSNNNSASPSATASSALALNSKARSAHRVIAAAGIAVALAL